MLDEEGPEGNIGVRSGRKKICIEGMVAVNSEISDVELLSYLECVQRLWFFGKVWMDGCKLWRECRCETGWSVEVLGKR